MTHKEEKVARPKHGEARVRGGHAQEVATVVHREEREERVRVRLIPHLKGEMRP
jgi:hypothetical protein